MSAPGNPHDAFFKAVFSRPETARDLTRAYLPPAVVAELDLASMEIARDSYVDEELRGHFSDLLYTVTRHGGAESRAFVYILFEHKSHSEGHVALQLLRYMVRIWEQAEKAGEPLWPILPVVVYHGAAEWQVPRTFHALLGDLPEVLVPFVPAFRYWLLDVSHLPDAEIAGTPELRVILWVLKSIFRKDLGARLGELRPLLLDLGRTGSSQAFWAAVLRYLLVASERGRVAVVDLRRLVAGVSGAEGVMSSVADELIDEGIEKGIEKGIETGLRRSVLRVLETRFGSVPPDVAERVGGITDAQALEALLPTALTVSTLDELRQALAAGSSAA